MKLHALTLAACSYVVLQGVMHVTLACFFVLEPFSLIRPYQFMVLGLDDFSK